MEWLLACVKQLTLSRTITCACFATAAAFYFGPRYLPTYIDVAPKEWTPIIQATMLFSGCLIVIWLFSGLWSVLSWVCRHGTRIVARWWMSENEQLALEFMAREPNAPISLSDINYEKCAFSKLEFLSLLKALERKGLALQNPYASDLFSLTDVGRNKALKQIHKRSR